MKPATLFILFLTMALCSCSSDWDDEIAKLNDQKAKWESNEPAAYEYQYTHNCFCVPEYVGPFKVTVENSQVVKVVAVNSIDDTWMEITPAAEHRIDALFQDIKGHLKRDPDSATVTYDAIYGFPAEAYFDMEENSVDEEWGLSITDFKVLN